MTELVPMIPAILLVIWMAAMIIGFRRWAKAFIAEFNNE
jgi:hypothetical protein